jgi:hypothetical protein
MLSFGGDTLPAPWLRVAELVPERAWTLSGRNRRAVSETVSEPTVLRTVSVTCWLSEGDRAALSAGDRAALSAGDRAALSAAGVCPNPGTGAVQRVETTNAHT